MEGKRRKYNNGRRHSLQTKAKALEMRANGFTHREIVQELGISRGSAFLWTIDIKITEEQKIAIFKRRKNHIWSVKERKEFSKRMRLSGKRHTKYSRDILISKIKSFYKEHARIPLKRELNSKTFRRYFGTWNTAIIAAGFEPNPILFAKRVAAADGHMCDSFAEKIIDDWFTEKGIKHERNIPYAGTKMTADFKVGNLFIEYFGLKGANEHYNSLIELKREFCRKHRITLLEIYPDELFSGDFRMYLGKIMRAVRQSNRARALSR